MPRKKTSTLTAEQAIKEIQRIGPVVDGLANRIREVERACRVMGEFWIAEHASEAHLKKVARRTHSLHNAIREVKRSLGDFGNEFDREPYIDDPL